jgi:hypothetical protein
MSRFLTRRRSPIMRDFNEHRARFDEYEANVIEADFQRHERIEDDLEARRDAWDSWTPTGDAA